MNQKRKADTTLQSEPKRQKLADGSPKKKKKDTKSSKQSKKKGTKKGKTTKKTPGKRGRKAKKKSKKDSDDGLHSGIDSDESERESKQDKQSQRIKKKRKGRKSTVMYKDYSNDELSQIAIEEHGDIDIPIYKKDNKKTAKRKQKLQYKLNSLRNQQERLSKINYEKSLTLSSSAAKTVSPNNNKRKKKSETKNSDDSDDDIGFKSDMKYAICTINAHDSHNGYKIKEKCTDLFDVLVIDGEARTLKVLFAISRGIPIVHRGWIEKSSAKGMYCIYIVYLIHNLYYIYK